MNTNNFHAGYEIINADGPSIDGYWPCVIDIGYAFITGASTNKRFCLPSYSYKRTAESNVADLRPTDIIYRDKDGEWVVGDFSGVFEPVDTSEIYDIRSVVEEKQYLGKAFRVFFSVALGLALLPNDKRQRVDEKIMVQTMMPTKLEVEDMALLKAGILGDYDFDLKVGMNDYVHFAFEITSEQLVILIQPEVYSAIKEARKTMVVDLGKGSGGKGDE